MVSCLINKLIDNPKNHLVVEPDHSVIKALQDNRDRSGSQFSIFEGAISRTPLKFRQGGYGSTTGLVGDEIQTLSMEEVCSVYDIEPDVLVADCEGAIESFVFENDMSRFKMIFLEKDGAANCNYLKVDGHLAYLGFFKLKEYFNAVVRTVYVNNNHLPFWIENFQLSCLDLGLFGQLGLETELNGQKITRLPVDKGSWTLSAHANSWIIIRTKGKFLVQGSCSKTSQIPPVMNFSVDNILVGQTSQTGERTDGLLLEPGDIS